MACALPSPRRNAPRRLTTRLDPTAALFLVVGGEKRGVTRSFADAADLRLSIPYGRHYPHSLGTTAAAAVLAFEIMRQRAAAR